MVFVTLAILRLHWRNTQRAYADVDIFTFPPFLVLLLPLHAGPPPPPKPEDQQGLFG
jgi:hypothetical protein